MLQTYNAIIFLSVLSLLVQIPVAAAAQKEFTLEIPQKDLIRGLTCSEVYRNHLSLRWKKKRYLIDVPEIVTSPLLEWKMICQKFLPSWKDTLKNETKKNIAIRLVRLEQDLNFISTGKRYRLLNESFYQHCKQEGYCKDGLFGSKLKDEHTSCRPTYSTSDYLKLITPTFRNQVPANIKEVSLTFHPKEPLFTRFQNTVKAHPDFVTFASSMGIGMRSFTQFYYKFRNHPSDIFFALDGALLLTERSNKRLERILLNDSSLYVIPMTPGRRFKMAYHWKIVANSNMDETILSSMNLSNPPKALYSDATYTIRGPAAKELEALLYKEGVMQCQHQEDFECMSKFAASDESRADLSPVIKKGCTQLLKNEFALKSKEYKTKPYFVNAQDTDVVHLLKKEIKKAKKEILIAVHRFNLKGVYDALIKAVNEGKTVRVFVGSTSPFKESFITLHDMKRTRHEVPKPHMKFLIRDRESILFGTGNYTHAGLIYSRELFALSDNKETVQKALRYITSLEVDTSGLKAKRYTQSTAQDPWVVYPIRPTVDESIAASVKKGTKPVGRSNTDAYYRVKEEYLAALKKCNAHMLSFIPADVFHSCIEKQK